MSFEWTPAARAALRSDDRTVWDQVFTAYNPQLYKFCYGILGNKKDAEDIAIIAITKLWEFRDRIETISSIPAWLNVIARNGCLDLIRGEKRYRHKLAAYRDDHPRHQDPATENEHDMLRNMVTQKLVRSFGTKISGLTEQQRTVFLYYLDHLDIHQIAEIMNLSPKTVHQHLQLARKTIANTLKKMGLLILLLILWALGKNF